MSEPRTFTQDEIDDDQMRYEDDEELSDEDIAEEECGRWRNGRLDKHCLKAGSEECDWVCPLREAKSDPKPRKRK